MQKFWHLIYSGYNKGILPIVFIHCLIHRALWDTYWYRYVVPLRHKSYVYKPTPLKQRIKSAWHNAKWGEG